jgi:hypothetical protein
MTRPIITLCVVLGIGLTATVGSKQPTDGASPLRLLLSEVQAGTMASEQYCTLVFADHRFHSEKAVRKLGKDRDRKVYEGQLSDADWNALAGILDSDEFRELNVPQGVPPLVIEDAHTITISVARDNKYQNMEFLDKKSRKPFESQLKPLLSWWKTLRGGHMVESKAEPSPQCTLDSSHPVFTQ